MAPTAPKPRPLPLGEVGRRLHLPTELNRRVTAFDRAVDKGVDRIRTPRLDRVMYSVTELGDFSLIWHIASAARGLRLDCHAADTVRIAAVLGVESVLVNGVIKSFFRRTRPHWDQPRAFRIRRPRSSSFPSGHGSAVFTAAALLSEGDPLKPLYYGLATLVATSRVYVKIHHVSDVIGGIATGVVLGAVAKRVWPRPVDGHPLSGFRNTSDD